MCDVYKCINCNFIISLTMPADSLHTKIAMTDTIKCGLLRNNKVKRMVCVYISTWSMVQAYIRILPFKCNRLLLALYKMALLIP